MRGGWVVAAGLAIVGLAVVLVVHGHGDGAPPPAAGPRAGATEPAAPRSDAEPDALQRALAAPDAERAWPAARTQELLVQVLDAGDRPAAGADVSASDLDWMTRRVADEGLDWDAPAGRDLRQRLAKHATAGTDGTVVVLVTAGRTLVEARQGDRWAFALLPKPPADGRVVLRLEADLTRAVQVVDGAGFARAGVPVAIRRQVNPRPRYEWKTTATGPDGVAVFEHYQRRLQQGAGWHFVFAFPVPAEPALPVPELAGPELVGPVPELVLPGAGSLRIRVRDGQGRIPDCAGLQPHAAATAPGGGEPLWPEGPWSRPRLDARGEALVPWLGLGLELAVELRRTDSTHVLARAVCAGPRRDGETAACELVCDLEPVPAVTGRFVLDGGRPWPAAVVRAQALLTPTPADYPGSQQLEVDTAGRFRLELPFARPPGGSRRYLFSGQHPGGLGSVLAFVPLDEPPPGLDLGDVVLDHGRLLAAGRVVDLRGQPLGRARLQLAERVTALQQSLDRPVFTAGVAITGPDGAFALHLPPGELAPGGPLLLSTECKGYLADDRREIGHGDGRLVIVLAPAGALAGSLRLDDGLLPGDVALTLVGATDVPVHLRPDATFLHERLPAGVFTLQVRRRGADGRLEAAPAAAVDGIVVEPGRTTRDDRLHGLFVPGSLHTLRIAVVDRNGVPVPGAVARIDGLRNARATPAGDDGICRVRTPSLPVDVTVTAYGYRPHRLPGLAADAEAALDDGIAVRLRTGLRAQPGEPAHSLGLMLFEVDDRGLRRDLVQGELVPITRRFFDADGELALRLPGAGVLECELFVSVLGDDHVGRGAPLAVRPPPRITVADRPGEQVFDLVVPAAAVAEAIARARR
jgi:hypothetical protein